MISDGGVGGGCSVGGYNENEDTGGAGEEE